jgi:hypothetical protein
MNKRYYFSVDEEDFFLSKNETRIEIWGMDRNIDLGDIRNLLVRNYDIPIEYLSEINGLSAHDKTLHNSWIPSDNREFHIESQDIAGQTIRFINAIGQYEETLGEQRGIVNGTPLPREVRVFNKTVNVVFFQYDGRVYCALDTSPSQGGRIRSFLFGQRRGNRIIEWGTVEFKNIGFYILDSRFFYWLFSKRGQTLTLPNQAQSQVNVVDISAVSQLADRNAYDSTSQGANILASLPALSGLGSNQSIYNGGFYFQKDNTFNLFMNIDSNCSCTIDAARSNIFNGNELDLIPNNYTKTVLTLYTFLFPGLKELYNHEQNSGQWNHAQETDQRKQWALEVVKELCDENNINIRELQQIIP